MLLGFELKNLVFWLRALASLVYFELRHFNAFNFDMMTIFQSISDALNFEAWRLKKQNNFRLGTQLIFFMLFIS